MVTFYVTPFEIVTRLLIIPGALVAALFPMFSSLSARQTGSLRRMYRASILWVLASVGPIVLGLIFFGRWLLAHWAGSSFASESTLVTQILAVGVLINGVAMVPFALVQGLGRPDLTAKIHLFELPIYLGILVPSIRHFGIVGAATAWTIRVAVDALILLFVGDKAMRRVESEGVELSMMSREAS